MHSCLRFSVEMQMSFRCCFCYTHNRMSKSSREPSDTASTLASVKGPGDGMSFVKLALQWNLNMLTCSRWPKISKDLQKEAALSILLIRQWRPNRKREGKLEISWSLELIMSMRSSVLKGLCLIWKDAGVSALSNWQLLMIWGSSSQECHMHMPIITQKWE